MLQILLLLSLEFWNKVYVWINLFERVTFRNWFPTLYTYLHPLQLCTCVTNLLSTILMPSILITTIVMTTTFLRNCVCCFPWLSSSFWVRFLLLKVFVFNGLIGRRWWSQQRSKPVNPPPSSFNVFTFSDDNDIIGTRGDGGGGGVRTLGCVGVTFLNIIFDRWPTLRCADEDIGDVSIFHLGICN